MKFRPLKVPSQNIPSANVKNAFRAFFQKHE